MINANLLEEVANIPHFSTKLSASHRFIKLADDEWYSKNPIHVSYINTALHTLNPKTT